MRYEIIGCFDDPHSHGVPQLAELAMRWVERMHRAGESRDWALYRPDVLALARGQDVHLGPFEAFPDCRFVDLPSVSYKENTIRVGVTTDAEEDAEAIEDMLLSLGADAIQVDEQIDPREMGI